MAKNSQAVTAKSGPATLDGKAVRGYLAFVGSPVKGGSLTATQVAKFLQGNPTILRAQANALGVTDGVGSRGRISASATQAVAEKILPTL